jgi:FecR protein
MSDRRELDVLLSQLVDGLLDDAGSVRLNAVLTGDALARRRYREVMALHAGLHWDYAAAARSREVAVPPTTKRSWWLPLSAGLAAMLLLGVALGLWVPATPANPTLLTAVAVHDGTLSWSGASTTRQSLREGDTIGGGQLVLEGDSATASLRFSDGTQLTLTGDTELSVSDAGQKRLRLGRGLLAADVRPQAADRPLLIRTPTAELQVLGTVFTVSANGGETALDVESGRVRLQRLADGQAVEVATSQSIVVSLDVSQTLASTTRQRPPTTFRRTFAHQPPGHCKGRWVPPDATQPGRVFAVPYVAGHKDDGSPIIHHGVTARALDGWSKPMVRVLRDSILVLRYRFAAGQGRPAMKVMLSTVTSGGSFGGNFEGQVDSDQLSPDAEGWFTARLPMERLKALQGSSAASPIDHDVTQIMPFTFWAKVHLEVAEIAVEPGNTATP